MNAKPSVAIWVITAAALLPGGSAAAFQIGPAPDATLPAPAPAPAAPPPVPTAVPTTPPAPAPEGVAPLPAPSAAVSPSTAAAAPARPAQAPDPRVKAALDTLGYKYEVGSEGEYRLTFNTGTEQRTQLVYVGSATEEYDPVEVREVISPVMVDMVLSPAAARRLLDKNNDLKWGSFRSYVVSSGENIGRTVVLFAVQIDAGAPAATIEAAITVAVETADAMEKELTGKDAW